MANIAVSLVETWHTALNRGEVDRLAALVTPDVEMGGPRGVLSGVDVLRDWVARAHIRLHPLAY